MAINLEILAEESMLTKFMDHIPSSARTKNQVKIITRQGQLLASLNPVLLGIPVVQFFDSFHYVSENIQRRQASDSSSVLKLLADKKAIMNVYTTCLMKALRAPWIIDSCLKSHSNKQLMK
jgi:hypothetical protein